MQDLKARTKTFALDIIQSKADFISKLGTTEEEADETLFWLECLADLATREHAELKRLLKEADELVAIIVASRKRARE